MTGKRYFVSGYAVWDSYNNNKRVDTRSKSTCALLNQLNDENEYLKKEVDEQDRRKWACLKQAHRLDLENGQLKKENKKLKEENEQLKQFQDTVFVLINEMIETANRYRTPIQSIDYGDDLGYWNGVYQKLKDLREILEKKGDVA